MENIIIRKITSNEVESLALEVFMQFEAPDYPPEGVETFKKDIDGFSSVSIGNLCLGKPSHISCTPKGIIDMLKFYDIPMEGKDVVIISRSNIVGKPLAQLFLKENATVTKPSFA